MKKWLTGLAAAGWAALLPLGASAASPVTGEDPRSPDPLYSGGDRAGSGNRYGGNQHHEQEKKQGGYPSARGAAGRG